MIGGITVISLVGWVLPFGLGGRHWVSLLFLATENNNNADSHIVQWSQEDHRGRGAPEVHSGSTFGHSEGLSQVATHHWSACTLMT